jgi:hypothetical protein
LLEETAQLYQRFRPGLVKVSSAEPSLAYEARGLEYLQVLRNRRPAHVKMARYFARGQLPVANELEDFPPSWLDQGLQYVLHCLTVSGCLLIRQGTASWSTLLLALD